MALPPSKSQITRRHLPHWTTEGATYFVTMRLRTVPLTRGEIQLVLEHILSGNGRFYDLDAVVVMPDHVHLLLLPKPGYTLSGVMKGIKGTTARRLNQSRRRHGTVWQDESFDRIVRDEKEFKEKLGYMYLNPVKAGLTDDPDNYEGWYVRKI